MNLQRANHLPFRFLIIIIIIILIFCGILIFKLPFFNIQNFNLKFRDTNCISNEELQKNTNIKGKNLLLVDANNFSAQIKQKYPCVKEVKSEKVFPNSLSVSIEERIPISEIIYYKTEKSLDLSDLEASVSSQTALIDWSLPQVIDKAFLVDKTGFIFDQVNSQTNLPKIFMTVNNLKIGQKLDENLFQKLALIFENLNQIEEFKDKTWQTKLINDQLLIFGQQKIVLSLQNDVLKQVASLQLILRKAKIDNRVINMIDLRFDKPIIIYSSK